jgi:hypothetical protein
MGDRVAVSAADRLGTDERKRMRRGGAVISRSAGRRAAPALIWTLGALALAALVGPAGAGAAEVPDKDPFYKAPVGFEAATPGTVLRSREVNLFGVKAFQLLFRSSNTFDQPIVAVTTFAQPPTPWTGTGARPLVSYQMAIDGLGSQCNPSYQLQQGSSSEEETAAAMLAKGWAVNVPDHEGEDMEYGAGRNGAHAVLDSIRALYNFTSAKVGPENPLGLIGYSGGGQATAWTLEQQPSYAPELHIAAAAPGGIPVDLKEVASYNNGQPSFALVLAAAQGVDRAYPEMQLNSLLNEEGLAAEARISKECLSEYVGQYPLRSFSEFTKPEYPEPLTVPQVANVLAADSLPKGVPAAPTFLWQSAADEVIPVAGVDRLADDYCSEGVSVTYDRGASGEHVTYADNAPAAAEYLETYFDGGSVPSTCGTLSSTNTTITGGPSGESHESSAVFTYATAPESPGASFECKLDGGAFAACPSTGVTYTGLATGQHTFAVRSVTAAGHADISPATRSWRYVRPELLPELGRCAARPGAGLFGEKGCLAKTEGNGPFEWLPGPGARPHFSALIPQAILETGGGASVTCGASSLAGEWTGPKTAAARLHLGACHDATGHSCQSNPAAAGEIESEGALEGLLGFIKNGLRPSVGLELAKSGALLRFTCGEALGSELWTVEGAAIGTLTPTNGMRKQFTLLFRALKGAQSPARFEGGAQATPTVKRLSTAGERTEAATLTLRRSPEKRSILAANEELLEIKAKA